MPKKTDPIQNVLADARRNQILDAATKVFAGHGFHAATIRQVAKQAGIADGTIYLYFKNKDQVLLGILDRLNETAQRPRDFAQALEGDYKSFFTMYLRHRLELIDENFEAFQALLPDLLANPKLRVQYSQDVIQPSFELAEGFFQEWVARGVLKPVDVPLTIRAMTGMFLGLMVLRMLGDTRLEQEWDKLPDLAADLLLEGMAKEQKNEHSSPTTGQKTKKGRAR